MTREVKKFLKEGFEAPAPQKKKEFLRAMPTPPINNFAFVWLQARYIRKWIWAFSLLAFVVAALGAEYGEKDMLWCVSACMPLLALSVITESGRSAAYGMAEFELSTRFSLKSVVLARLGVLGAANLTLACLLIPFAYMNSKTTLLQTGVYIVCPYLLTVFLGLWATRVLRGKETVYLCAAFAVCLSAWHVVAFPSLPILYERNSFVGWVAALLLLSVGTIRECYKTIKHTEELAWNL